MISSIPDLFVIILEFFFSAIDGDNDRDLNSIWTINLGTDRFQLLPGDMVFLDSASECEYGGVVAFGAVSTESSHRGTHRCSN